MSLYCSQIYPHANRIAIKHYAGWRCAYPAYTPGRSFNYSTETFSK
ncbi:hypothetical protein KCP69_04180 [Salmonella enterica subsp. enterica]|nr:hypothetical protein KCP69_04180 [Salmonella enterica subsp. enterica]